MSGICLYSHFRADDNLMFYIGIGNSRRPWSAKGRSDWWGRVVAKHGYVVEVLATGLGRAEAQALERVMIAEFRSEAAAGMARLVNIMDSEVGDYGDAWRVRIAERSANPEWRAKMVEGNRKRSATGEWKANNAEAIRKRDVSPEWRVSMAIAKGSRPEVNANIAYMVATEPHSSLCYEWAYLRVKPGLYPRRDSPKGKAMSKRTQKLAAVAGRYRVRDTSAIF